MRNTVILRPLYSAVITAALPLAVLRLYWKSRKNKAYRERIAERFSYELPNTKPSIWIHAVSVGEFLAVLPLIRELQKSHQPLLITTTTPTGSAMVREKLGDSVEHCYLPFDSPVLVKRFLEKTQPLVAVFIETEIWPNYLRQLKKNATPTLLINARLSEKSFAGYEKFDSFARDTLDCFTLVACQNELSQQRFSQLGARADVLGNIKFDIAEPADVAQKTTALAELLNHQPFIIAASTHNGEDEIIVQAFKNSDYAQSHRLVIAPRHPERSGEIVALCHEKNLATTRYTMLNKPLADETQVVIVDTLGELLYFYALADIAIIGGSFVNHGGHNPLEAALFATPCIIGTHYFNFQTLVDGMQQANAIVISDASSLLQEQHAFADVGREAKKFLKNNQGSLARYVQLVQEQL